MPPFRVVALVPEEQDQAHMRRALHGSAELLPCRSPGDVMAALADRAAAAVVLPAHGPAVAEAITLTRDVREKYPDVPVLVHCDGRYTDPRSTRR